MSTIRLSTWTHQEGLHVAKKLSEGSAALTRYACGHVGAEIGVKAKAFVRWAELRGRSVTDESKKCVDCK
jgi:hypothetical protein